MAALLFSLIFIRKISCWKYNYSGIYMKTVIELFHTTSYDIEMPPQLRRVSQSLWNIFKTHMYMIQCRFPYRRPFGIEEILVPTHRDWRDSANTPYMKYVAYFAF